MNPQPPHRPRRSWMLPAVVGGALLVGVLTMAAVLAGTASSAWSRDSASLSGPDTRVGSAAAGQNEPAAPRERRPKGDRPLRLDDGEKVVAGAVVSVSDGTLVVRKDNGAEVSVPTDGDTKVTGAKNRALTDLDAGERVVVKVGADGRADGVLSVRAHLTGTVTALDGDRATVVRTDGLSTTLDLSGVGERPAVGTTVVAVGTAADGGASLTVEHLEELATLG